MTAVDNFVETTSDRPLKVINEYVEDGVAYISGTVQWKLLSSIKCEGCAAAVMPDWTSQSFYINHKTRGSLLKPNKNTYEDALKQAFAWQIFNLF